VCMPRHARASAAWGRGAPGLLVQTSMHQALTEGASDWQLFGQAQDVSGPKAACPGLPSLGMPLPRQQLLCRTTAWH